MDSIIKPECFKAKSGAQTQVSHADSVQHNRPTEADALAAIETILRFIGDDPNREGLKDTPRRVLKAYSELFGGYEQDAKEHLQRTFEEVEGYKDIVLMTDIEYVSHCEHHMVPFIGKAHIAYYPKNGVVGLSKLARVVDIYARRLQTQEALTQQIHDTILQHLDPRGLAVMLQSEHLCMSMRGIKKQGTKTTTAIYSGLFEKDPSEQLKFLRLVEGQKSD